MRLYSDIKREFLSWKEFFENKNMRQIDFDALSDLPYTFIQSNLGPGHSKFNKLGLNSYTAYLVKKNYKGDYCNKPFTYEIESQFEFFGILPDEPEISITEQIIKLVKTTNI